jgi:hypothetical protein
MTKLAALVLDNEDLENDWCWEVEISADVAARVERLKTGQFTRLELYEELLELMAVLEVYWRGLSTNLRAKSARPVAQIRGAKRTDGRVLEGPHKGKSIAACFLYPGEWDRDVDWIAGSYAGMFNLIAQWRVGRKPNAFE